VGCSVLEGGRHLFLRNLTIVPTPKLALIFYNSSVRTLIWMAGHLLGCIASYYDCFYSLKGRECDVERWMTRVALILSINVYGLSGLQGIVIYSTHRESKSDVHTRPRRGELMDDSPYIHG
jgi:hypothetical protein